MRGAKCAGEGPISLVSWCSAACPLLKWWVEHRQRLSPAHNQDEEHRAVRGTTKVTEYPRVVYGLNVLPVFNLRLSELSNTIS